MSTQATTYKIGKFTVTQQAYLVFLAGTTLSVITLLASVLLVKNPTGKIGGVTVATILFGLTCYSTYAINCTIVGKCEILAWILVFLNIITFASYAATILKISGAPVPNPKPSKKN